MRGMLIRPSRTKPEQLIEAASRTTSSPRRRIVRLGAPHLHFPDLCRILVSRNKQWLSRMSRMRWFSLCSVVLFASVTAQNPRPPAPSWMTLSGSQPLVIANGGQSGLFPDQTLPAYIDALNKTAGGNAFLCNLQLTKDLQGICRTGIDLATTTTIEQAFPNSSNSYPVNGLLTNGYFAIDFTAAQLLSNVSARQTVQTRLPNFDGQFAIISPENLTVLLGSYTQVTGLPALLWLNVENAKFYEDHKINMTSYVLTALRTFFPAYVSSTEVALLQTALSRARKTNTTTIFKVPSLDAIEPTTNRSYGTLLRNLTTIKSFASGILVPKELIWPVDKLTLKSATSLVKDAHAAGLEVHAYNFANDVSPTAYNYSLDPIKELLYFINGPGFSVDGVLTDFPTTASVAVECYATQAGTSRKDAKAFKGKEIFTHSGGDSGNYPGSTQRAYLSAISKGANDIDCPVQMTKDGVPICRQSPDLLLTTDALTPFGAMQRPVSVLQPAPGIFTFDLTWDQISTLRAKIYSPQLDSNISRNEEFNGQEKILRLVDFLDISKANPTVGTYIVLTNAYILNASLGLDTAAAVTEALTEKGLDKSTQLVIQSEDAAALRSLQQALPSATLIYSLPLNDDRATLTDSALSEISQFARGVAVPRRFISPSNQDGVLIGPTKVVQSFHAHNLSVLVVFFRNEFVSLPFDFLADPTLELDTYVQFYGIDGIVTDFPGTAKSYMTSQCTSSRSRILRRGGFVIPTIVPGLLFQQMGQYLAAPPPTGAPAPLNFAEPPAADSLIPRLSPAPAPAPATARGNRSSARASRVASYALPLAAASFMVLL